MTSKEYIQNIIDTRGQWGISPDEYWEGHHIIFRCKGGTGDPRAKHNNIIWLYAREHYEIHRLEALEHPHDWDIVNAFHCISHMCADTNKRIITAEEYEEARKLMSECIRSSYPYTIECIETGELFRCPAEAAEAKGGTGNHIGECCRGLRITCNGLHYRFYNCDEFEQKQFKGYKYYGTKSIDIGPIICIESNITYERIGDFCNDDTYKCMKIIDCCRGKSCTAYGYHWEFADDRKFQYRQRVDKRYKNKKIICVETREIFSNITEAYRKTSISNIGKVLRGEREKAGGYHWKYLED